MEIAKYAQFEGSDENVRIILASVREAMGSQSRVLVRELVLGTLVLLGADFLQDDHILRHTSNPSAAPLEDGLDKVRSFDPSISPYRSVMVLLCLQAPKPMLPNYGAGQVRIYNQDLMMMMQYNTKERTTSETIAIG